VPARCAICDHKSRAEIEASARSAASLEALVAVCAKWNVRRAAIERHLKKCAPSERSSGNEAGNETSPDSGPRAVGEGTTTATGEETKPLPPLRELRTALEELRHQAQLLTRQLEREDLTPTQLAQVSNALRALHRQMTVVRQEAPIHEHHAFDGLVLDLVAAVIEELGPKAADGLEVRVAARFEQLQAERVSETIQRRRAA